MLPVLLTVAAGAAAGAAARLEAGTTAPAAADAAQAALTCTISQLHAVEMASPLHTGSYTPANDRMPPALHVQIIKVSVRDGIDVRSYVPPPTLPVANLL